MNELMASAAVGCWRGWATGPGAQALDAPSPDLPASLCPRLGSRQAADTALRVSPMAKASDRGGNPAVTQSEARFLVIQPHSPKPTQRDWGNANQQKKTPILWGSRAQVGSQI